MKMQLKSLINGRFKTTPQHDFVEFPIESRQINLRQMWAANRFWMESEQLKSKRYGGKSRHHWDVLYFMMKAFEAVSKVGGFYKRGYKNALNLVVKEIPLSFSNLPESFKDFSILHLTDLHLGCIDDLTRMIIKRINGRSFDLCVLTGDYRKGLQGPIKPIMKKLELLVNNVNSHNGFIGVLGNHDDCRMVNPMEDIGIKMLINEHCYIYRGKDRIKIIGTDDVHYYYTEQAQYAFEDAHEDFSIGLVHSPEIYDIAAERGVNLYLCGHTHGGQICLPGGTPIIKHLNDGKRFYHGIWKHLDMTGVTSAGVGTSGIPIRFNTQGEILVIRLKKSNDINS